MDAPVPPPSSFATTYPQTTHTRVKWDNVLILLVGVVMAALAVTIILTREEAKPEPAAASQDTAPLSSDASTPTLDEAQTLADAQALVEEARGLMRDARWTEAADRLDLVEPQFDTASGAAAAKRQLEQSRAAWTALVARLETQVAAKQWEDARTTLDALSRIARLDSDLLETRALVDQQLAAAATPAAAPAAPAGTRGQSAGRPGGARPARPGGGANVSGGGGSSRPASSGTRPAGGSSTRPGAGAGRPGTNGSRPGGTATGGGSSVGGVSGGASGSTSGSGSGSGLTCGSGSGALAELPANVNGVAVSELQATLCAELIRNGIDPNMAIG